MFFFKNLSNAGRWPSWIAVQQHTSSALGCLELGNEYCKATGIIVRYAAMQLRTMIGSRFLLHILCNFS